ncbi:pyrimidine/purine nucleotide monophosphate nucleosidase domain-containing protein, partial [Escherichia sp. R-CC3]
IARQHPDNPVGQFCYWHFSRIARVLRTQKPLYARDLLGENARRHYRIIIDDAAEVARQMKKSMPLVKENRRDTGDAYSFNWSMRIAPDLQMPFEPSHENMANLKLYPDQPVEVLAADLRRAFSGIVAG